MERDIPYWESDQFKSSQACLESVTCILQSSELMLHKKTEHRVFQ